MKKIYSIFLIIIILLSGCQPHPKTQGPKNGLLRITISSQGHILGRGTGFLVRHREHIFLISAAHVALPDSELWVSNREGLTSIQVKNIIRARSGDIVACLVTHVPSNMITFEFANNLNPKKPCQALGLKSGFYPSESWSPVLARGLVLLNSTPEDMIVTRCELLPGMSGGPLLQEGKVVGVNCAYAYYHGGRIGLHCPSDRLRKLLEDILAQF